MTFEEIYNIKKETGLNNALIEMLASENEGVRKLAMDKIKALNFKNADDVKNYIALNA